MMLSTSSASSIPSGQAVRVQEAPTHFASDRESGEPSLCGDFAEYSLPAGEFQPLREFWEPLGFVALEESDTPYLRMSMTSDHLDLAVHRPRMLDAPMLVFAAADMGERIEQLRTLGCEFADRPAARPGPAPQRAAARARRHLAAAAQLGRLADPAPAVVPACRDARRAEAAARRRACVRPGM